MAGTAVVCSFLLVAAIAAAAALVASRQKAPRQDPPQQATGVLVHTVASREIVPEVVAYGRARPLRRVVISAQVGGAITAVHADIEDGVIAAAGTVAVQIDRRDHEHAAARIRAQVEIARAERARLTTELAGLTEREVLLEELHRLEREELERAESMQERGLSSSRDADVARLAEVRTRDNLVALRSNKASMASQLAAADARILDAEAQLAQAELDLERCTISLPFTGQIALVAVEEHQLVSPGTKLFELWQVDRLHIPAVLSVDDAFLVAPDLEAGGDGSGTTVLVRPQGADARSLAGALRRFESVNPRDQTVTTIVEVECGADGSAALKPGVFCEVVLRGQPITCPTAIPIEALQERGRVYVAREGRLEVVDVDVGRRVGAWVLATDGLRPGDMVIVSPLDRVIAGMPVRVVEGSPVVVSDGDAGGSPR